ncbi:MAG: hypothetical protein NVSMB65_06790 [Chloroflexota bacterium]
MGEVAMIDQGGRSESAFYRALLEHATDLVAVLDARGVFRYASPSHEAILGYTPDELVGKNGFDHVHPDDQPRLREALAVALKTEGAPVTITFRRRHADGSWRLIETRGSNRLSDPVVQGLLLNSRDITARRQAEEQRDALLAREQQARAAAEDATTYLRGILDVLPVAVAVADATGRVVHTNAEAQALWGRIPLAAGIEEYREYKAWWPRTERLLAPEEWALARALQTGEICTGEEITIETFDGKRKTILNNAAPIRDDAGRITGGVVAMLDITASRQVEQRTHEALNALLQMAQTLVAVDARPVTPENAQERIDAAAGRLMALIRSILGCQRVSLTAVDPRTGGTHPVAVVGLTPREEQTWRSGTAGAAVGPHLTAPQRDQLLREGLLAVQASEVPGGALPFGVRSLLLTLLKVGDEVVGVLSLDHGAVYHVYSPEEVALARAVARLTALVIERERLLHDRAAAQAAALALREANRRMDEFLGLASHELRTPLTIAKGNLQLTLSHVEKSIQDSLAEGSAAPAGPALLALLARADRHMDRLTRLVNDLSDISRILAGKFSLFLTEQDLRDVVDTVVQEQRSIAAPHRIESEIPEGAAVRTLIDGDRIDQVLTNYLTNARKYSPAARPIRVGLSVDDAVARVWVRDEGPGLPLDEQTRIWDRFYQVASIKSYISAQVGLGLGLYICRTIVEQHGGQVGVVSTPGEGATFWFTLPLLPADMAGVGAGAGGETLAPPAH